MLKKIFFFSLLFLFVHHSYSDTINFKVKVYSNVADKLMKDHGLNGLYKVPLTDVDYYLPELFSIKRRSLKLIDRRLVPGKTALSVLEHCKCERSHMEKQATSYQLFSSLREEVTHTYVILDNKLIFTESTDNPILENAKDKLTKHYLLSKLKYHVRYSGEFHVYKNNDDIYVIFDNSSGTYRPDTKYLPQLSLLLNKNFNKKPGSGDRIFFMTKSFNQKLDKEKIFTKSSIDPK